MSNDESHRITAYSVERGVVKQSFGGLGSEPGQFNAPQSLCWDPRSVNILVAEWGNKRVQEVTVSGTHVRFVGVDVIDEGVAGVACNDQLIAVAKCDIPAESPRTTGRVLLFNYVTGAHVRSIGDYGSGVHQLGHTLRGLRFHPSRPALVVCDVSNARGMVVHLSGGVEPGTPSTPGNPVTDVVYCSDGLPILALPYTQCVVVVPRSVATSAKPSKHASATAPAPVQWDSSVPGVTFKLPVGMCIHDEKLFVADRCSAVVHILV